VFVCFVHGHVQLFRSVAKTRGMKSTVESTSLTMTNPWLVFSEPWEIGSVYM
jgi:hypothetical protein